MEFDEFKKMIGHICRYWERRIPKEEEGLEWFEDLKWIPDGYGEMIFQRFKRMDTRPVNIPLRIQEVYRGLTTSPKKQADFLIGMIMKNAEENDIDYLEAFYDLRYAIRRKEVNIGPTMRWLRSIGFVVDLKKLQEPSAINFTHLNEYLKTGCGRPKEIKSDPREEPGEVFFGDDGMIHGMITIDVPFQGQF